VINPIGVVTLPEDACTVTMTTFDWGVGVGVGVGGKTEVLPPPPPHAERLSTTTNAATIVARTSAGRRSPVSIKDRLPAKSRSMQTPKPAGSNQLGPLRCAVTGVAAAGRDATLTVRAELSFPFAGNVPFAGLKLQESPAGKPGQLKVNTSVSPFWEFNERLNVAELPTGIVAEFDEIVLLTPCTWSTATGALCVTPSADAETENV
jgi:hypothetical protein